MLAFYSPDGRFDDLFTSNYVTLNVLDQLKRLPGTTNVQIFGAHDYAMRVWVKPDRLAQLKLSVADVIGAHDRNVPFTVIPEANFNVSVNLTTWLRAKVDAAVRGCPKQAISIQED